MNNITFNGVCDLHTHSVFSDGTYTPEQIIREAEKIGLSAVALCDHNTAAGLPRFLEAAKNSKVEAVAGVEFSCEYMGKELHILGLFMSPLHFESINELVSDLAKRKEKSNADLVSNLAKAGYVLELESIKAGTPNGQINRAHIAAALMEKGYVSSVKEAFDKLLHPQFGFFTPPRRPEAYEMIEYIKDIGAAPVLAHPFLNLSVGELHEFLPEAKKKGLVGMETVYSLFGNEESECAASLALKYGLLPSGGSDFHGSIKPDIALGSGKGNISVPMAYCVALQKSVTEKQHR